MFMIRLKYFGHLVELGYAVASKTLNRNNFLTKFIKLIWHGPLYLMSKTRRQSQFKNFITSGDRELLLKIAKSTGNTLSRFCCYFLNPRIKFHKKIYIPRSKDRLTTTALKKALDDYMMIDENPKKKPLRHMESFSYLNVKERLVPNMETFSYKNKSYHL